MDKVNYDLIFCVLACAKKDKYKNRLKKFISEYGYKWKNKDLNIKIVFLVEDEPRPDFLPEEYGWHNSYESPIGLRLINYIKTINFDFKWLMQVDDDSSTDLDKTLELLDQFYESKDAMILMGGRNTDLESGLQLIIRKMDVKNFFFEANDASKFNTTPYFIHAWEPSILSKEAVKKIKQWREMEEFINLCKYYKPTFSDQLPYVIARLVKIPIVECLFLSPFNSLYEYSGVNKNGRYSHIHYVVEGSKDYETLINFLRNSNSFESQKSNLYEFWAHDKVPKRDRFISVLSFEENGKIGIYKNFNERFWEIKNDKIYLYDENRNLSSLLWKTKEKGVYIGSFIKDANIIHKLISLKK